MEYTVPVPAPGTILAVDSFSVPQLFLDGAPRLRIKTVLVAGAMGDYAAYRGIGSAQEVKAGGDKLTFEEACHCFEELEKEKYRA